MRRISLVYIFMFCIVGWNAAQPVTDDLPQITGCIALINAKVISAPGKEQQVSNIILRDGLITHVGKAIPIPADAYRIQADSLYVYPAFIDAFSITGIKEQESDGSGQQGQGSRAQRPPIDEEGNPSLEDAGITPFQDIRSTLDAKSKTISDWRAQGFAIAHVVPKGRMLPGKGTILVLAGKDADQIIWKENISMFGQWIGASGNYPATVIAVMAKWRELYQNATQLMQHQASYQNATLVSRPLYNRAHESLIPVVKGELPLFFRAPGVKDISRALEMQKDLGMKMVIADATEAWYLKDQFKSGARPLVLSLDLPEDKSEDKKKTEEKTDSTIAKDSIKIIPADPEKEAFEKKRTESLKSHYAQASVFAKEGIPYSFGTYSVKSADFTKNMQLMLENGLSTDQALSALTTQPAKLLGIEKNCGSVEVGKMANLIVATKPVFEKDAAIRYMIVEGNLYEYEVKEKKKKSEKTSDTPLDVLTGTWSYSIETPDQKREGTMEFTEEEGEIIGTIKGKDFTGGNDELEDVVLDGNTVSFTFDFELQGQPMTLEFDLTLKGESFEGNVTVGEFGSFAIQGQRTSKPE